MKTSEVLRHDALAAMSQEFTRLGDRWRDFAAQAVRYSKDRMAPGETYAQLPARLRECADREEAAFRQLAQIAADLPR